MERVLLIGGEGYIGNVITNYLTDKGYLVTSFDKLLYDNSVCVEQKKELDNYHFIEGESIAGDSATVILNLFNEFENYNTPPYTFVVPKVVDSDPPEIQSIRSDTTKTYLYFTEPIEITGHKDSIFYVIRDSANVYLSSHEKRKLFNNT